MKLKKVDKDDYMKCCRWCRYFYYETFKGGMCNNPDIKVDEDSLSVYSVSENGYLSETLKEVLNTASNTEAFKDLKLLIDSWNISKKKKKEFEDKLVECYEKYCEEVIPVLDDEVMKCYVENTQLDEERFEIKDPENFVCKWWC